MKRLKTLLARLWNEKKGQDLVEYALLLVMIGLATVTSTKRLSNAVVNAYSGAKNTLSNAASGLNGGNGGNGGDNDDGGRGGFGFGGR